VFTSAVGEVSSVKYPTGARREDAACEIYIVGTPGKHIEMIFNEFAMSVDGNESCLHVSVHPM
jgi:hypothetical protein